MAIGRISGPLLAKNLLRDGVDLAFETDLLYLDVKNGRLGVRKANPAYELDVNGTINANNLRVTYTGPGTGQATLGKLVINSGTISTTVGPVTIQPTGNADINLVGNTNVTGNIHATGNISADGNIVLGNNLAFDTVAFNAEIASNFIPQGDKQHDLGSDTNAWASAYVDTLVANALSSNQGNISVNPAGGLLDINGDIRVTGKNPIGTAPVVTNVLYVTMDGNDTNDGRAEDPSRACKTITGAIRSPYYRPGTLIRVRSGHYLENNPLLLLPNTAVIGDDLRTTSIEPINKTQDLFHVQSGCYLAQMQFLNGRSGVLPGPYASGSNRGAFCAAFPPLVNGVKLDVYQSPYIQNCTNQSGPWLMDGTMFVPNQTIQIPNAVSTTTFVANTNTIVVTMSTGTVVPGMSVISGPQNPGFFNARTLLLANKDFIKDQVITYINDTYPTFTYEQAKCARDVGLILENVAYDATFGGNEKSVESGLAYWNGVINLIEGQQEQTTAAIRYINTLSQFIIQNQVAPVLSTATTQVINTSLTGGEVAKEEIEAGINIIAAIINSGTTAAPTVFKSCGPENPLVSAEILLQANRTFLQEETTAYVNAQYPNFEYKEDYCYRDVGLMVDAISQDILVGGNTKTIEAALSYYTGSKGDSSVAEQAIIDNFTLIRDIIVNGSATAPEPVVGPNLGTGFSNAKDILLKNKQFVQTEISAYVRSLFDGSFRLTQAQQDLCYRDVGLILEAVAEDTAAGGNANSVYAALQYFNGNLNILPVDEIPKTALALEYMLAVCRNIVKNVRNTGLFDTTSTQVMSLPAATTYEVTSATTNLELITDIITLGPSIADPLTPINLNLTTNTNAINAFNVLTANKDFLAAEVTGYIDDVFGNGFEYNAAKCERDTGLIVDSIAFDLLYNGNTQAIFAGLQYYTQGTTSIPNEQTTTTNAITYAKQLAKRVIINDTIVTLQTATTQTFDLGNPGDEASTATVDLLFTTVTNIITNGTVGVTNTIVPNGETSVDSGTVNSYTLLQANKAFIEDEVIAYVDSLNSGFTYDRTLCSRDVGLIVDALAQDLLFSTSSQSTFAGLQYWNQAGYIGDIANELTTTTNAITYVRDLALKVITNDITGSRYQTAVSQVTSSTGVTVVESQTVYDDFNLILDIIINGTVGVTDRIVSNNLISSTNANVQQAYTLLQANRYYLQTEAIAFVEATKTRGFVYDPGKCLRDVGYMVDSVSFDVLYGGNQQAIQSGVYYYGFSNLNSAVPNEQAQVTAAYNYIKDITAYIVTGQRLPTQYQTSIQQVLSSNVGTAAEANTVAAEVDIITNIVNNGPTGTPSPINLVANTDPNVINAAKLLAANREFIRAETIAYIDRQFPQGFVYNRTTCRRDVGYIIDCVSFDLLHGGNRQSIQAGVYYFGFNSSASYLTYEVSQAIAAYNHIKNISRDIIKGIAVTTSTGNTVSQIILANTATNAEADLIAADINIITDIIANGPSLTYPREPISLVGSETPEVFYAYDQLLANRDFIKAEVIAYINATFKPKFTFDKIKCTRDTKLIVDSIALDLLYDGNTQSTFAALQYWAQGTSSIPAEETTTTNAISYLNTATQALITNPAIADIINDRFNLIIGIISTGTAGVTDIIIPNTFPSTNTEIVNAYETLMANKSTLQAQTVAWVDANNPGFVYNTSTCYRDAGYIIDCVAFDILHGGNRQSIQAGVYYYGFDANSTNVPNEIPQTTAAYTYLKSLIKNVLVNNQVVRSYQTSYPQVIIPAYMGVASAIEGEETVTVDAINYLKGLSLNVISNTPVPVVRSTVDQTIYTSFEGGQYASDAVSRNYDIISNVILNGPEVAPVPFVGSGFFATTGVSSNDVRESPTVLTVTSLGGNQYRIKLSESTVGDVYNGTLYFGQTSVFPLQNENVPDEWAQRRIDPVGAMGGTLVDGAVVSDRSPIQSFVFDAFTQVNQGGRGVYVTNNGYAQLVSVFTIFCSTAVQVDNGGICSITNSNSNFGDQCLVAKGYGKRDFSGTVYNPPFPAYQPNGEYYPAGFYPKNGVVEIFVPDSADRPHIALVMEVEPPLGHTNEQGLPGFLNAAPTMATLTTGTITITGIDTTGIAVGNKLYIRDQYGNTNYVSSGTEIVDVNYQSITLNKGLANGGGDINNPNFFNLYACGNAYYTVLSSSVTEEYNTTTYATVIPPDQIGPESDAISYLKTAVEGYLNGATVNAAAVTFVNDRFDIINQITTATNLTAAQLVVPAPVKKGTPPNGASLAIATINLNLENLVADTIAYINATYPGLTYNQDKCARDVRLILRQINYDLELGGNYYSTYAGLSYWIRPGTHHVVNLEESVNNTSLFPDGAIVNFYQRSYMSASGYLFEYVGAGTNYGALPQRGIADPVQTKEVIQLNNGKVFFTSTDQNGDFRIGPGLVVSQSTGVLSGRTFTKSLFANLTPFILAIEGGG